MALTRFQSVHPAADLPQLTAALEQNKPQRGARTRGWYSIQNVSQEEAEIAIFDFIGRGGVQADQFISDLNEITAENITLRVNSPGGDVFDGFAIFNALRRHKSTITAFVDGVAASAASYLIMGAESVVMSPHSQLVIHEATGLALGPADDMRKMADVLDKMSDNIASVYAERAGGPVAEWRALMKEETFFSDHEAVVAGLAERVDGEEEAVVAARIAARLEQHEPEPDPDPAPPSIDWLAGFNETVKQRTEAILAGTGA